VARYEGRVFWVVPFLCVVYLLRRLYHNEEAPVLSATL
jgi:hypothetical protein